MPDDDVPGGLPGAPAWANTPQAHPDNTNAYGPPLTWEQRLKRSRPGEPQEDPAMVVKPSGIDPGMRTGGPKDWPISGGRQEDQET